ncbi:MAG: acetyl-CoA carboxylase biotin carboxylase subunit [bacterium]|jgi:acetyl-CoA carboxylase biotin carboxylase subunit
MSNKKIKRILIANRGEIALRVIRTCREMGIESVSIYSSADRNALHIVHSNHSVHIPGRLPAETYLNINRIVGIAKDTGCDAVHPGYGFLAENAEFAKACAAAGIKFIGPSPDAIEKMGNKIVAKEIMSIREIPVIPGSAGAISDPAGAMDIAKLIGFPLILKAAAGGGGRGMRVVRNFEEFDRAFRACQSEAMGAFGSDEVFIEKLIENPKHIEFQVMGDEHGNVIHFGERDCSVQRRHQKLIEEAPSPALTPKLREEMGRVACEAARAANYSNAGTVEFLLDGTGKFYFMEMNTRLQVEHPVTEEITGTDLVREQILVASGEKLTYRQDDIEIRGHSFEARINAEDPYRQFLPAMGKIRRYIPPLGRGVRLDAGTYEGYTIPMEYDSMVAKLIATGSSRAHAIERMKRALGEFIITGIKTTIPFHQFVFSHPEFVEGRHNTAFVEKHFAGDGISGGLPSNSDDSLKKDAAIAAALDFYLARQRVEVVQGKDSGTDYWELASRLKFSDYRGV